MKKHYKIFYGLLLLLGFMINKTLYSQTEESNSWTTGADFYSSFIWRGTKYGTGPAFQPVLELTTGSFKIGAWGSFDFTGYQETDIYFSFSLSEGFSLGMTDYYSPDLRYFDYSRTSGSHAFEINLGYSKENLNLSANYILNKAGNIGSLGSDLYFQVGYAFSFFSLFIGAGNGWHTYKPYEDKNIFNVCNIGLETSKTIIITDRFSIPVIGKLIFNPDKEQMFIVVGFTL